MNLKNVNLLFSFLVIGAIWTSVSSSEKLQTVQALTPILVNDPIWKVDFGDELRFNVKMNEKRLVNFTLTDVETTWGNDFELHVLTNDNSLLTISDVYYARNASIGTRAWSGSFNVQGLFLGRAEIYIQLEGQNIVAERSAESLDVIILRNETLVDQIFMVVVGAFVMVIYINFGAALDLKALKGILLRPIGPTIGFIGQYVVMPLTSFVIGYFLFHDMIELRLGLFFTGTTPAGGFSNIYTVLLNGNLDLSITMTAISNLAAFAMMPLWILTLGALIFRDGAIPVPYKKIALMSWSMVIPLSIGIAMQIYFPRAVKVLIKMMKPIAFLLVVVIIPFAIYSNSFIFRLFSWEIVIASAALPWCGYVLGWIMALALGQSQKDALTIGIETGVQNNGIAIFMLLVTLPQPQADLTSVVPMASSMLTPLPLLLLYLIKRFFCRTSIEEVEEAPNKEAMEIEIEQIMTKK